MLNAANSVDKQQHINQQQGQLTQSQNAMAINDKTAEKLSQPQETAAEPNSKQISSDEKKQKRWMKSGQKPAEAQKNEDDPPTTDSGVSGRMIDIKI
jgi:hypothetical protein